MSLRHVGGIEVWLHSFLTYSLVGCEWLTSRSDRFISGTEPRYQLSRKLGGGGGGGGSIAGVYGFGLKRISYPIGIRIMCHPSRVASRYAIYATLAPRN